MPAKPINTEENSVNPVAIILDTDPGIDDAVAIAAALFHPGIELALITTVAGNVDVSKTTRNTLRLLHFFDKEVPVAQGASQPLVRPLDNASHIHGHSGLDGYEFAEPGQQPLPEHAVEAMKATLLASKQPMTLVPIGPLTNIALLLTLHPECREKIERIVLMGGSAGRGNHTPNAEFNIYVDPEAAHIVFSSGLPIVMCGLDVTSRATLTGEMIAALPALNRTGSMLHALFGHYRGGSMQTGLKMHDLCAIAYLVRPDLFITRACHVAIETRGEHTLGTTSVDINNRLKRVPNAEVCLDIDVPGFRAWCMETLARAI